METRNLAGAVVAAAVVVSIGTAVPAAAEGNNQVVGIEQAAMDPNGAEISYTVTKLLPSVDAVAYPVAGQLYEASVMARATEGSAAPQVQSFSASAGGTNYPALVGVSSLSGAPLGDGATTDGKIYFDVVGSVPTTVVYSNPPQGLLTWSQPVAGGGSGGSSTEGPGGTPGGTGSSGQSPVTSGGDIGGQGGGTEGGGGNLSSGGGSGAPNGDTGGSSGSANGSDSGGGGASSGSG